MKKSLKISIALILFISQAYCGDVVDDLATSNFGGGTGFNVKYDTKQVNAKIDKILKAIDMQHFVESIEIDWTDWGTCQSGTIHIPGVAFCFDEPLYVGDYSPEALKVQSLGIRFAYAPQKNGYARKGEDSYHGFGWNNIIKLPFLGMVLDTQDMCMDKSDVSVPYLSFLDPTYSGVFAQALFADTFAMMSPSTILLGALDCAAASAQGHADTLSATGKGIDYLRVGLPHYMGCWNTFPAGGWGHNSDPIIQATTSSTYALAALMRSGAIPKSTKVDGFDGKLFPDTMCGSKASPHAFVKPQFYYSLVTPGISQVVPLGAIASEWAEFKNDPSSADEAVYWIWSRRCIYLGAAKCK